MSPEIQAMMMQMAQQMGIMPGASAFSGHNDMLLGSFGMPTSASIPYAFQSNQSGFLQQIRNDYIDRGGDRFLERLSNQTGINPKLAGSLVNMFPQLQQFTSTRADMLGGSYAFAQSMNPYMATTLPQGEAGRDVFKQFEEEIYSRTMDQMKEGGYRGIRSERDAGALLSFAAQRGMVQRRGMGADGQIKDLNADEMADQAEKIFDQFDSVLEVGRKIFGPNAKASQIMQKMSGMAGSLASEDATKAFVGRVNDLATDAFINQANVGAVFSYTSQMSERLKGMGVEGQLANNIAMDSSSYAVKAARGSQMQRAFFMEQYGTDIGDLNFETLAAARIQDRVRYEGQYSVQLEKAKLASKNLGWGGDDASAQAVLQNFNMEWVDRQLTEDQRKQGTEEFEKKRQESILTDRFEAGLASMTDPNIDKAKVSAFFSRRYMQGSKKAAETRAAYRKFLTAETPEAKVKARAEFSTLFGEGVNFSESDMADLKSTSMLGADEGIDPFFKSEEFLNMSEEKRKELWDGYATPRMKADVLLEKLATKRSDKVMSNLKALDETKAKVSEVTDKDKIATYGELSEEELMEAGVFRHTKREDGELKTSYWDVEDMDTTDAETAADMLRKAGAGGGLGQEAQNFLEMLLDALEKLADKITLKTDIGENQP